MKRFTLAIAVMFVVAVSANAAVVITSTGAATTELAGYTTWTVNATSDSGPINGIDVTFTGAMNQVNPAGNDTIFTDANGFFGYLLTPMCRKIRSSMFAASGSAEHSLQEGAELLKAALRCVQYLGLLRWRCRLTSPRSWSLTVARFRTTASPLTMVLVRNLSVLMVSWWDS